MLRIFDVSTNFPVRKMDRLQVESFLLQRHPEQALCDYILLTRWTGLYDAGRRVRRL